MSTLLKQQPIPSKSDTRKYRLIKLDKNELEVLLVSDPETDKSSAAINVNVGQLQDPIERQGLAHFLEHMLFLGTKKYPDASQFDQHLSDHAGYSNAYTSLDQTNYYFHCANNGFKEALDRFAQFFIGPLFTQDLTTREMNAVNSENQKNLQVDAWREYQLFRSTSKAGNVLNKFGTGNLETLNFPSTRDDLIKFYETYYSSNIMKGVVLSNESLDEIQALAEGCFSEITNRNLKKPTYTECPFDASNMGKLLRIVPIKTEKKLKLNWLLPNYEIPYKKNPAALLSRCFGHEGEFSLLSSLMSLGLAESLSSSESDYMGLFSTLSISVTLTEKGFDEYIVVLNLIFAYTKLLRESMNQEWIFNENKTVEALKFDYKDKEEPIDCTYVFAESMQNVSHEDILRTHSGEEKYDAALIQGALDALTLENLRIILVSPSNVDACNLEEYYYKVKYSIEDLPEIVHEAYKNPVVPEGAKKLGLPKKNLLLPTKFDLLEIEEKDTPVTNVLENEKIEVYHKKDNTFKVPKVMLQLRFKNNDGGIGVSASAQVNALLWTNLLNEFTRELMYDAEMACLQSELEFNNELTLKVEGFSDSIETFVRLYFEKLVEFNPATLKGDFEIQLGKLQKQYTNFFKLSPYQQGAQVNESLLLTRTFAPKVLLEESKKITFESLVEFHSAFLKNVRLELLVAGNINAEGTLRIAETITQHVFDKRGANALDKNNIVDRRMVAIGENKTVEFTETLGEDETNNYICTNYQVQENVSAKSRVLLELFGNFFSEPFFTQLRTTECLGYICWTRYSDIRGVGLIRFIIQSNVQPPQYLASRIANFLKMQEEKLKKFTAEQFETLRSSVEVSIKEKDVSIRTQAERYFQYITQHHYEFDLKEKMLAVLKEVTLQEVQDLFEKTFISGKRNYQLHLVAPKHLETNTILQKVSQIYNNHTTVEDGVAFKVNSTLHPDYYAYRN